MSIIKQLPEEIAIKIAAGEVVERPASIIKELVENSIDAGATQVEILLQDGGKTFIEVKDNGSGIDRDDAAKAFLRHGTSKIQTLEDLDQLVTLGFRGEALAAIGASSEVELTTTLPIATEGTKIIVAHGAVTSTQPHAPIPGTSVRVSRLFADLPARQKFLKSDATEWRTSLEIIMKQMIAHPAVGFVVKHNNRIVFDVPTGQELLSRVAETWKIEQTKLIELDEEIPHMRLTGVVAKPEVAHEGKARQFLTVNGHPVNDKSMAKAVREGFGTMLPPSLAPSFALNLTIHPGIVDVNIHPRKEEVRFINGQEVFRFVWQAVSQALANSNNAFTTFPSHIKTSGVESDKSLQHSSSQPAEKHEQLSSPGFSQPKSSQFARHASLPHIPLKTLMEVSAPQSLPKPILSLADCFFITIHNNLLLLVDQHAAHERILYNRLFDADEKKTIVRQPLLIPSPLTFTDSEEALFAEHQGYFERLGFGFFRDASNGLLLAECPDMIKQTNPGNYFKAVLLGLHEDRHDLDKPDLKHKLFATLACKAAVKAGDVISETEKRQLIDDLFTISNRFTCPHGRPSYIEISTQELEKLFKRKGF